jgi:RecB family endonuclease NucS
MLKFTAITVLAFATGAAAAFSQRHQLKMALQKTCVEQSTRTDVETSVIPTSSQQENRKRRKILKEPNLWEYNFGLQDHGLTLPHGIIDLKTSPETFTVTEEQIRTLEKDGVLHIKNVFDDEWVDYLRQATGHQVDEPHFWAFAGTASRLYDYIQRNVWQTNKAFARFYYHSAMGHVLAQCGRTDEIRVSTDLLMVNPNKGFKWHQDNQNGPITWEEGLRFWITMDETPKDYGAPVYLKGSHRNTVVDEQAVFVDINQDGLEDYKQEVLEFRTMPGDMLIWHPRTIHKVDGPEDGVWTSYRRVLGGTVAKGGATYHDKRGSGGVLSDLGRHTLKDGDKLSSPFFPIVYPKFDKEEAATRDEGKVGRSPLDIVTKIGGLATKASGERFSSFFKVMGSREN